jgi:hypothetical protein
MFTETIKFLPPVLDKKFLKKGWFFSTILRIILQGLSLNLFV